MDAGIIVLWSGAIVDIPVGFVLCDGNNGTPNLLNRFVVAAGDVYDPDDIGGNITHAHNISLDDPALGAGTIIVDASPVGDFSDTTTAHDHGGGTGNADGRPPYYALAYIMAT